MLQSEYNQGFQGEDSNEGAITMEDLEEFSDELKERVRFIAK